MNKTSIISTEVLLKINEYARKKLEIYPFGKDCIAEMNYLTTLFNDEKFYDEVDYNSVVNVLQKIQNFDITSASLDESARAIIRIRQGKLILAARKLLIKHNKAHSTETEKKKKWEEVSEKLFGSIASKSERFKLMNIAKIPKVEAYFFLGISRLKEIVPLVSESKSDDPIGELLSKSNYTFSLSEELNIEDFIQKIKVAANCQKLDNANVPYVINEVEKITKNYGIVTDKFARKLKVASNAGSSITDIENKKNISNVKSKMLSFMDPSYNKFDETVLQLSEMIEDILNDKYVPGYDPELTARWLMVLLQMNDELLSHWSANWSNFRDAFWKLEGKHSK